MREMEFLPPWYTQLHRRRRFLALQVWMVVALACGLAGWQALASRNSTLAARSLESLRVEINQKGHELRQIEELSGLQTRLQQQKEIQSKLGLHVEACRLLGRIAPLMPEGTTLLNMEFQVEETVVSVRGLARASLADPQSTPTARQLRVRMVGVAPTGVDVANFITALNRVPYFENVNMTYTRDHAESQHLMREFEITFVIRLSRQEGA